MASRTGEPSVWPNFFIAGVPKAGTTSLHRYLAQHPEIFMSNPKETYFFNRVWDRTQDDKQAFEEEKQTYLSLFQQAGDAPVRGESSPRYFSHPGVPDRIRETVGEARFVVSLRDPVKRAHSEYLMNKRDGVVEEPFLDLIEEELDKGLGEDLRGAVLPGLYATHLERYWEAFGEANVHVMLLDDLKEDPLDALVSIAGFLGVDEDAMRRVDYQTQHNPYRVPRGPLSGWLLESDLVERAAHAIVPESLRIMAGERVLSKRPEKPGIEPAARERLVEVYAAEIDRLEQMLDRSLPQLRSSWDG